jgi:hypothetical protein
MMCLACNSFQLSLVFQSSFFLIHRQQGGGLFTYHHASFSQLVVIIYYKYSFFLFLSLISKKMVCGKNLIVGFTYRPLHAQELAA